VLVTGDQTLSQEQSLTGQRLAIVTLSSVEWRLLENHLPKIIAAIDSLYLASDSLAQRNTVNGRKLFYQNLRQCQQFLLEALEQFIVTS
jgi:hypothetical protein